MNCGRCTNELGTRRWHEFGASQTLCDGCRHEQVWSVLEENGRLRMYSPKSSDVLSTQTPENCNLIEAMFYLRNVIPSLSLPRAKQYLEPDLETIELDRDKLKDAVAKSRVVIFGESHEEHSPIRKLLLNCLRDFVDAGFTHLGLELRPSYSAAIDKYLSDNSLETCFKELYRLGANCNLLNGTYLQILKAAKDLGMQFLYLNSDNLRDKKMFDLAKKELSSEGTKIVCLIGAAHAVRRSSFTGNGANEWFSLAELLSNDGIGTYTIMQLDNYSSDVVPPNSLLTLRPSLHSNNEFQDAFIYKVPVYEKDFPGYNLPQILITTRSYDSFYWSPVFQP